MSDPSHHPKQRRKQARQLIVIAFLLVRLGDPLLLSYSFQPANPMPLLRGLIIGGILSTTVFFVAVWLRHLWARYVLIALIWLLIVLFSTPIVLAMGNNEAAMASPYWMVAWVLLLYGMANTLLIRSRRIRRYVVTPPISRE